MAPASENLLPSGAIAVAAMAFIAALALGGFWAVNSVKARHEETIALIGKEVHGRIRFSRDLKRGSWSLHVSDTLTGMDETLDLQWSYFIKSNHIQVGDSLAKTAGESSIRFYKRGTGGYDHCCSFQLN